MAEKKDPGGVIDDAARLVGKTTRDERAGGASTGGGWSAAENRPTEQAESGMGDGGQRTGEPREAGGSGLKEKITGTLGKLEEKAPMRKGAKPQGGMGHKLYEAIVHKGGDRLRKFMGEGKHPRS